VELEIELQASLITVEPADDAPDSLSSGNDSPFLSGQAAVGFQN
jgi:hypothetical protein